MQRPAGVAGRYARADAEPDDGMVTAELAMALPVLALVASLVCALVGLAADISRASDAARAAARSASIGNDRSEVVAAANRLVPAGSDVSVSVVDEWVQVAIGLPERRWGPLPLPAPTVTGAAPLEPGVTP